MFVSCLCDLSPSAVRQASTTRCTSLRATPIAAQADLTPFFFTVTIAMFYSSAAVCRHVISFERKQCGNFKPCAICFTRARARVTLCASRTKRGACVWHGLYSTLRHSPPRRAHAIHEEVDGVKSLVRDSPAGWPIAPTYNASTAQVALYVSTYNASRRIIRYRLADMPANRPAKCLAGWALM